MALQLASPGINVREVDLTRGGVNASLNVAAGLAGPFQKGPVNEIIRITNENELVETFGGPGAGITDFHYETWYAASNYLSYGGQLEVVRAGGGELNNANAAPSGTPSASLVIENYDDYSNNHSTSADWYFAAKNPGHWGENIKVAVIDAAADQIINGVSVNQVSTYGGSVSSGFTYNVGYGVTQKLTGTNIGVGTVTSPGDNDYIKGIVTEVGTNSISVKVVSVVQDGTETAIRYQENSQYSFNTSNPIGIASAAVGDDKKVHGTSLSVSDWYNNQDILTSAADGGSDLLTLKWRSVLPKPRVNGYSADRGGDNDSLNVVVIDVDGNVNGTPATILEKFPNLSKASDSEVSPQKSIYYKQFLADNSAYVYAGTSPAVTDSHYGTSPIPNGFSSGVTPLGSGLGSWGQAAKDINFNSLGNVKYDLGGGKDYQGIGNFNAPLGDILTAYDKLSDPVNSDIRFLLQGGAHKTKEEEQAKAQKLISICEFRKDCITFISPDRGSVVNITSESQQTENVLSFFSPLSSSSYAVFDSGYQYTYDRFNKKFCYLPISNDIGGLCVRTDRNQFPWFSPAGTSRGSLNFAVKLAYNPGQDARDRLYSNRINPVIASPGAGIILFGDKTGLAFESAFDRINVRRLFITIEKAIENAAKAQLFELNDPGTRSNFLNIVEPYLRDVQAKRGINEFLVVCDESNNTPDVIDRNEFVADIFVKPARSINFIGLTFVATRTGISFSEVVGTV